MQTPLVDLVEAAYRVDVADQPWLEGLLEAVLNVVPDNGGAFASVLDAREVACPQVLGAAVRNIPPDALVKAISLSEEDADGLAFFRTVRDGPRVGSVRSAFGDAYESSRLYRDVLVPLGVSDVAYIYATDIDGFTCTLGIPVRGAGLDRLRPSASLDRLQAHLAAAYRLRRYLATGGSENEVDAVLDPDGRIQHVTRSADSHSQRAALRAAAQAVERARGPLRRRDGEEALSLWNAMVMGQWTLVDRFERDGRRFVVACRNRPRPRADAVLTRREREIVSMAALGYSNKLTAYALGLSPSTVATHTQHACAKLGVLTRAEMIRVWVDRAMAPVGGDERDLGTHRYNGGVREIDPDPPTGQCTRSG